MLMIQHLLRVVKLLLPAPNLNLSSKHSACRSLMFFVDALLGVHLFGVGCLLERIKAILFFEASM